MKLGPQSVTTMAAAREDKRVFLLLSIGSSEAKMLCAASLTASSCRWPLSPLSSMLGLFPIVQIRHRRRILPLPPSMAVRAAARSLQGRQGLGTSTLVSVNRTSIRERERPGSSKTHRQLTAYSSRRATWTSPMKARNLSLEHTCRFKKALI